MKNKILQQRLKVRLLLVCLLVLAASYSFAQDSSFTINLSAGWKLTKRKDIYNGVMKDSTLSKQVKEEILSHVSVLQMFTYAAPYKSETMYRPTIQILVIKNQTKSLSEFRLMIENSIEENKAELTEIKILEPVSDVVIDGKKSLYAKTTGSIISKTGNKGMLISRVYTIPYGQYFYHITMNDSNDYNCENDFKNVLTSIKF